MSAGRIGPRLSVVVVCADRFAALRRTVAHLAVQDVSEAIERVVVAPSAEALADLGASETAAFGAVRTVLGGAVTDVDKAAARGVAQATAPVVALVEDHAYPCPGWARALLDAHEGPWDAVGSIVLNANPRTMLSWANLLLAYGEWSEPPATGETTWISRHNVSFKREVLARYGDGLEARLGRDGGLLHDLRERGARFYLAPGARIEHANPSRLAPTVRLRFDAGRLFGATRAAREGWPGIKRLVYVLGGPLIPPLRFVRFRRDVLRPPRHAHVVPRVLPALALALLLDGAGQTLGYAAGAGRSAERLARFEIGRLRHLDRRDRALLAA